MRLAAPFAVALALGLASPASAQDADKARLDDFALPADEGSPRMEQLAGETEPVASPAAPATDRIVAVPGPPAPAREPVEQLSDSGTPAAPRQLSDPAQSRQTAAGSVSSPRDSRPQPAAALAGQDRCDPQADPERFAECRRILELRAAEFAAAEPPRLTAEQALLAARGDTEEVLAAGSSQLRVRLASADPDADLASNQELASIYLDRSQPPAPHPEKKGAPDDATLAEILQGLQVGAPGATAP